MLSLTHYTAQYRFTVVLLCIATLINLQLHNVYSNVGFQILMDFWTWTCCSVDTSNRRWMNCERWTRWFAGMLTSLDQDKSRNFFSCARIKFLRSRVWRMSPKLGLQYASCCKRCSVWLPDPGGWMTGWGSPGKTAVTAFEVSSGVVGGLSPAPSDVAVTGVCLRCGHLNCWSTVELFTHPLSHAVRPLRRWPSFTVLHLAVATPMAASVYFSDTGWSEWARRPGGRPQFSHTRRPSEPLVCRISCQRSSSPIGSREIWNPVHSRNGPLQRGSISTQQTDVTVRDAL